MSIADFSAYETAFSDFLGLVRTRLPPPYDVVAHSLGGAVVVDHLLLHESASLRHVVLLTPLIRDGTPRALRRFGHAVSLVIDHLPRIPENSSSDPAFPDRVKTDPLQYRCVSSHWLRSFSHWQRQSRIADARPSGWVPLVLNADTDTVIDAPYSEQWMRRTFPKGRFMTIEGSRHQLLNEAKPLREQVLGIICEELGR